MKEITTRSFRLAVYAKGDPDSEKLALVLPGRLDTKDYAHMRAHVDFLSMQGYFALSFDPPGTWESPGGIELYTTTNYLQAVDELIEHFGAKPTLLLGHSRGGAVAMLSSTNPAVQAIAVMMANFGPPVAPRPEALKTGFQISKRSLPPGDQRGGEQRVFHLPINYFEDGIRYDPLSVFEKCLKPKLLVYGTDDEFTPAKKVKEIFADIPEPKMLHEVHTGHDYRYSPTEIEDVNDALGKFLKRYLWL